MRALSVMIAAMACATSLPGAVQTAHAQAAIGQASRAQPSVVASLGARRAAVVSGSDVHQNELIQTSAVGGAQLDFRDSTTLTVGPGASVKLDRYVYNPDRSARQVLMNMGRGSFRFVTGQSNPAAFSLQTPHAVIGLRGTIVEFDVTPGLTSISLLQGQIVVCLRNARRTCITMNAGQRASVSLRGFAQATTPGGFDPARDGGGDGTGGGGGGGRR